MHGASSQLGGGCQTQNCGQHHRGSLRNLKRCMMMNSPHDAISQDAEGTRLPCARFKPFTTHSPRCATGVSGKLRETPTAKANVCHVPMIPLHSEPHWMSAGLLRTHQKRRLRRRPDQRVRRPKRSSELGGNSTDSSRHVTVCLENLSNCVNCSPDADLRGEPPFGFLHTSHRKCCANRRSLSRKRLSNQGRSVHVSELTLKRVDNGCPNKGSCMHVVTTSHPAFNKWV
jgi:hypothetical protein